MAFKSIGAAEELVEEIFGPKFAPLPEKAMAPRVTHRVAGIIHQ
jgi:hypothetical protein